MMFECLIFYYIKFKGDKLRFSNFPGTGAEILIWNNQGMCGIISKEKVKNMIQCIEDISKLPGINKKPENVFHWDEVEIIDPKVAKLLFK